jgi:hypothetical protein
MSAIKATAYALPIFLAFTNPSFASFLGGGHIGGGFHSSPIFHSGGFNQGFRNGGFRDARRSRFFSGGFWCTSYTYEIGVCPYEY